MGIPDQYKTGVAHFMDFEFGVTVNTLIPRSETEILVEKVIEEAASYPMPHIVDIGTGSGNIAISLTKYLSQSKIFALDISISALLEARRNAERMGAGNKITFIAGDLLRPFKKGAFFDIIVSNPPYVSESDMATLPDEVKHEPVLALYGGKDGLDFYRQILKDASGILKRDGAIIMELGYDQSKNVKDLLKQNGFSSLEFFKDYNGITRIAKARAG